MSNLTDFFGEPLNSSIGEYKLFESKRGIIFTDELTQVWLQTGSLTDDISSYPSMTPTKHWVADTSASVGSGLNDSYYTTAHYDIQNKVVYSIKDSSTAPFYTIGTFNLNSEHTSGNDYEHTPTSVTSSYSIANIVTSPNGNHGLLQLSTSSNKYWWRYNLRSTTADPINDMHYKAFDTRTHTYTDTYSTGTNEWHGRTLTHHKGCHVDTTHGYGLITVMTTSNGTLSYKTGIRYYAGVDDDLLFSSSSPTFTEVNWASESEFANINFITVEDTSFSEDTLYVWYRTSSPTAYHCREIPLSGDLSWGSGTENQELSDMKKVTTRLSLEGSTYDTLAAYESPKYVETSGGKPVFLVQATNSVYHFFSEKSLIGNTTASGNSSNGGASSAKPWHYQRIK